MALHNRRNGNREAIETFANQFDPPLSVVETKAVAGNAVSNGYTCSFYDPDIEVGITAVVWGGGSMKVWMESLASAPDAQVLGQWFADILESAREGQQSPLYDPLIGLGTGDEVDFPSGQPYEAFDTPNPVAQGVPDEDRREPGESGLLSDRMGRYHGILSDNMKRDTPLMDWLKRGPAEMEFPNPCLVDMGDLSGSERLALVTQWPELKFKVDSEGLRYRHDNGNWVRDDRAGYCTEQQLAHVRIILGKSFPGQEPAQPQNRRLVPRMPIPASTGAAGPVSAPQQAQDAPQGAMGRKPSPTCDHVWIRNSVGDGATCQKCGGFERTRSTRERQAAANAQAALERLEDQKWKEKQAKLAELQEQQRKRFKACEAAGGHEYVTMDGDDMATCAKCGHDVPAKGDTAAQDGQGSQGKPV